MFCMCVPSWFQEVVIPSCIYIGLRVSEVAHDHQVQVKKYIIEELHLKNSSDTWHGMYNMYNIVMFIL